MVLEREGGREKEGEDANVLLTFYLKQMLSNLGQGLHRVSLGQQGPGTENGTLFP